MAMLRRAGAWLGVRFLALWERLQRVRGWVGRLRSSGPGSGAWEELDEELRFHLDMEIQANLREGLSPREARRRALVALGGKDWTAERVREERGGRWLEDLARDLRFGLRSLRKRPVFALAAILTLALGIGMTTTMFALVDTILLRPLPGTHTRGMVYLQRASSDGSFEASPSPQLLRLVRDHATSFSHIEAYSTSDHEIAVEGEPLRATGATASVGFFSFLGVRPILGRSFLPDDARGTGGPVVLLSYAFWERRFGAGRDALGRTVRVGDQIHEVIGVLPPEFRVDSPREILFWLPAGSAGVLPAEGEPVEAALARLAPGVSLEAARAELDAIVRNDPLAPVANMTLVGQILTPRDLIDPGLRRAILLLQAGAFLVLLIGCGNLANLLLTQGEARARELAVRASLGAGRGRLVRQLLAESLALGVLGGVSGVLLTLWALEALPALLPAGLPGLVFSRDVFLFAGGASLLSVGAIGVLPALRGSRRNLLEVIKGGSAGTRRVWRGLGWQGPGVRQLLVGAQVAMAFMLLASAGLLLKSLAGLGALDPGFRAEDLMAVRVELPDSRYPDEEDQRAFLGRLRERLRDGVPPAVGQVAVASGLVENLAASFRPLIPEGSPGLEGERRLLLIWGAGPGFFETAGIPVLQGREFIDEDGPGAEKVVILGEALAGRLFPDVDPVGRRVQTGEEWLRVVGVAGEVRTPDLARSRVGELQLWFPLAQDPGRGVTVLVRVAGDRTSAAELVKQAVREVDPFLPVLKVAMVADEMGESLGQERTNTALMGLFALTALALGAVGIYGVVAYSVGRQLREIGIRVALGASAGEVVARVVTRSMRSVGVGVAVGGVGAAAIGKLLSGLLHEVHSRDPGVLAPTAAVVVGVALLAAWLPARRAAGSGPVESLRSE